MSHFGPSYSRVREKKVDDPSYLNTIKHGEYLLMVSRIIFLCDFYVYAVC